MQTIVRWLSISEMLKGFKNVHLRSDEIQLTCLTPITGRVNLWSNMPDDGEQFLRVTQLLRDRAKTAPDAKAGASSTPCPASAENCFPSPHRAHASSAGAGLELHFCCKSLHEIHGKHLKPDLAQSKLLTNAIVPPPHGLQ